MTRLIRTLSLTAMAVIVMVTAAGRASAASHVRSVLIVMSDFGSTATTLRNALVAEGIPVVLVDARCGGARPSLATLQAHDTVIVWTNCMVPDGAGWGDALADYVDGGGHVVLAAASWYAPLFDIEGRMAGPGYSPFDPAGAALSTLSALGTYNASSPLMTGVGAVTSTLRDRVAVDPGATLVARWADGVPFVAVSASCRVVGINAYPGAPWTGDLLRLLSNAVNLTAPCSGGPPVADAGADRSVNEQQVVTLDGTGSNDPDGDALGYSWLQTGGTPVLLSNPRTAQPTFTAPTVAIGGETLTFELTVTANGDSDTDTVSITVVNENHTPVADAGQDQSVAEGAPVLLDGTGSFDSDNDPIRYAWTQISGPPVTLVGADTASPSFSAPVLGSGGAPGVLATLVFRLVVDDGFPPDAPPPGYRFANVEDTVAVDITNTNHAPSADAGSDRTVNENSPVTLTGGASSDPDGDALTYLWTQTAGPPVTLTGATTSAASLTTPFVAAGGADLTFTLTVDDGYGGMASDTVVVHVQNANDPPLVSAARATVACLWPPNHALVSVGIVGVSDSNSNATITIDRVTQDESTYGLGDGDTATDAIINRDGTVLLRAERDSRGDGRVYHVHFTASDPEGTASGVVTVCVPSRRKGEAIDSGQLYDSTTRASFRRPRRGGVVVGGATKGRGRDQRPRRDHRH